MGGEVAVHDRDGALRVNEAELNSMLEVAHDPDAFFSLDFVILLDDCCFQVFDCLLAVPEIPNLSGSPKDKNLEVKVEVNVEPTSD